MVSSFMAPLLQRPDPNPAGAPQLSISGQDITAYPDH
jgi:hypothetical protein